MKNTWKVVCIVSLTVNALLLGLWLTGHLKYDRYSDRGPVLTARMVHGNPMLTLPDHSRRMAVTVIRSYDSFVRSRTSDTLTIGEAYSVFFAGALAGYNSEDWDIRPLIPGYRYFDNVARILFREPGDLLPIASLDYVSPAMLSEVYDDGFENYSGWHLGVSGDRNNIFFRSLATNNRQWGYLVERAVAIGDFLPPGFLKTLADHPEYFDFRDEATRLYISLAFLDRYIQYNPAFRLLI